MKKRILFSALILCCSASAFADTDTIRSIDLGSPMFDPNELTITSGDTVVFVLDPQYNAIEVSFENWSDNNATGLPGGFSVPYGGGELVPTPGTHYFICQSETSMKGTLNVGATTTGLSSLFAFQPEVFPNPSTETLFFKGLSSGTTTVTIEDLAGRVVLSNELVYNGQLASVNVADLPRGTFIVTLSDGISQRRQKVILK